ncbi:MAG: TetR/AcrR family transcriptional regulator, partial [Candidatus Aminicenantes bacterium]|nr:TetR/AcrR family transcriptional regulator [Candidatus Aminicenantes bacterium]
AEQVFFAKGMDAATMDELAEKAELSKGTLYLYFKSKEDIYLAITERALNVLTSLFEEASAKESTGMEKVRAIGFAYFRFSQDYPDYFKSMAYFDAYQKIFSEKTPSARECAQRGDDVMKIVAQAVASGIQDGSIRSDIDPIKTALILWAQSNGVLQMLSCKWKHIQEQHISMSFQSTEEFVASAYKLIEAGLEPRS